LLPNGQPFNLIEWELVEDAESQHVVENTVMAGVSRLSTSTGELGS